MHMPRDHPSLPNQYLQERPGKLSVYQACRVTQIVNQVGIPGLADPKYPSLRLSASMNVLEQLSIFKIQVLASFNVLFQLICAIYA